MYLLGTSGWYYEDWIKKFYPQDLDKSDWLNFYSKNFDTVEVNASFYRLPFENMVKGWRNKTPDDFYLTFKGSRIITHRKKLHEISDYLNRFYERIELAEDKVGCILWQLPPNLHRDDKLLEDFLSTLNEDFEQAIEFRHKSWFTEKVYSILEKYDIGFVILSAPADIPTEIKVTSDFAYIRWHGKKDWYKYNYSEEELKKWADIISDLDVEKIYGYFNNDYEGYAVENCHKLKELLEK